MSSAADLFLTQNAFLGQTNTQGLGASPLPGLNSSNSDTTSTGEGGIIDFLTLLTQQINQGEDIQAIQENISVLVSSSSEGDLAIDQGTGFNSLFDLASLSLENDGIDLSTLDLTSIDFENLDLEAIDISKLQESFKNIEASIFADIDVSNGDVLVSETDQALIDLKIQIRDFISNVIDLAKEQQELAQAGDLSAQGVIASDLVGEVLDGDQDNSVPESIIPSNEEGDVIGGIETTDSTDTTLEFVLINGSLVAIQPNGSTVETNSEIIDISDSIEDDQISVSAQALPVPPITPSIYTAQTNRSSSVFDTSQFSTTVPASTSQVSLGPVGVSNDQLGTFSARTDGGYTFDSIRANAGTNGSNTTAKFSDVLAQANQTAAQSTVISGSSSPAPSSYGLTVANLNAGTAISTNNVFFDASAGYLDTDELLQSLAAVKATTDQLALQNALSPVTAQRSATASHPVLEQLSVQIRKAANTGQSQRFTVRLDPPQLGNVQVELRFAKDKSATAKITAERQETLNLLQKDVVTLQKTLADAGITADTESFSFDLAQQDFNDNSANNFGQNNNDGLFEDPIDLENIQSELTRFIDPDTGLSRISLIV